MAGAYFEVGNITPSAEFNVYVDPDAADIVFRSGLKLTLLPLDVTHQMLSTPARLQAMRDLGNACGVATAQMLEFSEAFDLKKYGKEGAPLHGPCVPAYMMQPDLFSGRQINVTVETSSELTLGMTVADWWGITDRPEERVLCSRWRRGWFLRAAHAMSGAPAVRRSLIGAACGSRPHPNPLPQVGEGGPEPFARFAGEGGAKRRMRVSRDRLPTSHASIRIALKSLTFVIVGPVTTRSPRAEKKL